MKPKRSLGIAIKVVPKKYGDYSNTFWINVNTSIKNFLKKEWSNYVFETTIVQKEIKPKHR